MRQSVLVDSAVMSSANVDDSTFSLSVMPDIIQKSGIKRTNELSVSSMNSKWFVSEFSAHEENARDVVRTGTSSSRGVYSQVGS